MRGLRTPAEGDHTEGNNWDMPLLVAIGLSFKQQRPYKGRVHLPAFLPSSANEQLKLKSLECPTIFLWQWRHSLLPLLPTPINAKERKGGRERGEIKNKSKKTQGVLF